MFVKIYLTPQSEVQLKNKSRIEMRLLLRTFWFCNPQRKQAYLHSRKLFCQPDSIT